MVVKLYTVTLGSRVTWGIMIKCGDRLSFGCFWILKDNKFTKELYKFPTTDFHGQKEVKLWGTKDVPTMVEELSVFYFNDFFILFRKKLWRVQQETNSEWQLYVQAVEIKGSNHY